MNRKIEKHLVLKKGIKRKINKLMILTIIFLITLISMKQHPNIKKELKENMYEKSIKVQQLKKIYEKYFGNILSIDKKEKKTTPVFQEKISYKKIQKYSNGAKLIVEKNYMVPILESGVVTYIGEKEKIGNTILIEQIDGIETMYSNIEIGKIKLYDYLEKGELLGPTKNSNLYMSFQKNGKYLDYKKYI